MSCFQGCPPLRSQGQSGSETLSRSILRQRSVWVSARPKPAKNPPPPHDMTQDDSGTITNLTSILRNLSSFTLNSQKMAIPPLLEGHDFDALETAMGPKEQTHRGAKPSDQFPAMRRHPLTWMISVQIDDFPVRKHDLGMSKKQETKVFFRFFSGTPCHWHEPKIERTRCKGSIPKSTAVPRC